MRSKQAVDQKLSHVEFLGLVFQDEYERRENKKLRSRRRKANFRGDRTLDNFQFEVPSSVPCRAQNFSQGWLAENSPYKTPRRS